MATGADPDDTELLKNAGKDRRKRSEQVALNRQRREDEERPYRETLTALELASYAAGAFDDDPGFDPERKPIGIRNRSITIDSKTWARRIIGAARAWAVFPGLGALDAQPLTDKGAGFLIGERIFRSAMGPKATVTEIARRLERARVELGHPTSDFDHGDSNLGIWGFFRELVRHLDRDGWMVSRKPQPERRDGDSARPAPRNAEPLPSPQPGTATGPTSLEAELMQQIGDATTVTMRSLADAARAVMTPRGYASSATTIRAVLRDAGVSARRNGLYDAADAIRVLAQRLPEIPRRSRLTKGAARPGARKST